MVNEPFFFNDAIDDEVDLFIKGSKAKNTVEKDKYGLKRFRIFIDELFPEYQDVEIEFIEFAMIDRMFSSSFIHARKLNRSSGKYDGDFYQPDSLTAIRNSIQRVLVDRGLKVDIKTDMQLETSRRTLAAKRKELTKQGLGNRPTATRALTEEEVDKLLDDGYFGLDRPEPLQRLMWWCLTLQFGHRARDEARKLKFRDIKMCNDENGRYLEWDTERGSKMRTGESSNHRRLFNPVAYKTNSKQEPIRVYEAFLRHHPEEEKQDNSPFFLTVIPEKHIKSDVWFYPRPLGKNKIGSFLKEAEPLLQSNTGKSRSKISNHSARKTGITKLLDNNVHPLNVSQLSGHKSLESLKSYYTASRNERKNMSRILSSGEGNGSNSSGGVGVSTHVSSNQNHVNMSFYVK